MADDVLLRVLQDSTQARGDLQRFQQEFLAAIQRMEAAAKRPDFDPATAEARLLARQVQITGTRFKEAFDLADKEVRETAKTLNAARSGVRDLGDELKKLGKRGSGGAFLETLGSIRNILGGIGLALTGPAIVQGLRSFAESMISTALNVQKTRIELEALRAQIDAASGSTMAGGEAFEFAKRKAVELGFGLQEVVQSQARFEAATRQSNLTLFERRSIFESVIEAGRVLQLSQERINNAFLALEQIASKGRVSMEELRRQLGDQIPGALPILARELGITTGELIKMVEQGKLMADEALPALDRGLRKAFGPGLQQALETDAAAIARIRTQITLLKDEAATGFAEETSSGIKALATAAEVAGPAVRKAGEGVGVLAQALLFLAGANATVSQNMPLLLRFIGEEFQREQEESAEATRQAAQALNLWTIAGEQARETGAQNIDTLEDAALAFSEFATKAINAGQVTAEQNEQIKQTALDFAAAYQEAGLEVPRFIEDLSGQITTLKERLEEAVKEEEEFNKKLFETQGALFKSGEELEKLTNLFLRATASIDGFGAASAEQSEKALDFALKLAQGYRDMGAAIPTDLLDKIEALARASVDGAEKATKALREQIDAYAALGEAIPEDLLQRYDRLLRLTEDHARAVALSELSLRDFRDQLIGSSEDLETESEQLYRVVTAMNDLGLATSEQREVIEGAVQDILDRFATMGVEPPEHFKRLAESLDIVTSRVQKMREEVQGAVADLAKLRQAEESRADPRSGELDALREEREELLAMGTLSIEQSERLAELHRLIGDLSSDVEGLGQSWEDTGAKTTIALDDARRKLLDFVQANEAALGALGPAVVEASRVAIGNLEASVVDGQVTVEGFNQVLLKIADSMEEFGADVSDVRDEFDAAADPAHALKEALNDAAAATDDAAHAQGRLGEETEKAKTAQEEQLEAVRQQRDALEELETTADRVWTKIVDLQQQGVESMQQLVDLCSQYKACMGEG